MTQDTLKRIHRYYGWFLAVMIGIVGTLFVLACLDIYAAGPRSYSPEAIAQHFERICIPVYLGIAAILGGIALDLLLPQKRKNPKAIRHPEEQMLQLRTKTGSSPVKNEVHFRMAARITTLVIFVALMIYPAVYILEPSHFTVSNLNHDIVKAVLIVLVPAMLGLTLCWVCRLSLNRSFKREIGFYKQAFLSGQKAGDTQNKADTKKDRSRLYCGIRIILLITAIIFIVIGIWNGGAEDVLKKAIAICTECIGLG